MPIKFLMICGAISLFSALGVQAAGASGGAYRVWEVPQPPGVARWLKTPVCPLVSGLPERDGEFVLERVSEIARTAGVPLAGEHCQANLYILVSAQPRALLEGMAQRNRAFTFSTAGPFLVDEFIATPRPVRVWYDTAVEDTWDMIPIDTHAGVEDVPVVPTLTSRLAPPVHYAMLRVFVIVDPTQVRGASRAQLADYIAMLGLAKLRAGTHSGDAGSILRLFDNGASAAPAGMTDSDLKLLKSLYE
jgi:hypothetical protein